jgi:hypothetical protein
LLFDIHHYSSESSSPRVPRIVSCDNRRWAQRGLCREWLWFLEPQQWNCYCIRSSCRRPCQSRIQRHRRICCSQPAQSIRRSGLILPCSRRLADDVCLFLDIPKHISRHRSGYLRAHSART